ncbi:MAG: hypothetical protein R3C03_16050 [Pirellulaceae bacterium]
MKHMVQHKSRDSKIRLVLMTALVFSIARPAIAQPSKESPWLLLWNSVEPRIDAIAGRADRFADVPFNGLVTVLVADDGTETIWNMWGEQRFELQQFSNSLDSLDKLAARDQFVMLLRMNVMPGTIRWDDESAWETVIHNTEVLASLASRGNFQGVLLDTEQYGHQLFSKAVNAHETISEVQFEACVRKRGTEWIEAIQNKLEHPTILLTYGFRAAVVDVGDGRPEIDYCYLKPFLEGVVAGAAEGTTVVDGWEYSYGFKTEKDFADARAHFDDSLPDDTKMKLGFGIWLDYSQTGVDWNSGGEDGNYFSATELCSSIRLSMEKGDGLTWIYSDKPNLWTGTGVSTEYLKLLQQMKFPKINLLQK